MKQFFGKYRGKVKDNIDPLQMGRIRVSVAAVLGDGKLSWAMPCVPYAGPGVGFFAIPPNGANVWVEFECGNPEHPIWTGCFWGPGEIPQLPALAQIKVFKTDSVSMTLSDIPGLGGFTLEVNPPAVSVPLKLALGPLPPPDFTGLQLTSKSRNIKVSPIKVSINDGALEVL